MCQTRIQTGRCFTGLKTVCKYSRYLQSAGRGRCLFLIKRKLCYGISLLCLSVCLSLRRSLPFPSLPLPKSCFFLQLIDFLDHGRMEILGAIKITTQVLWILISTVLDISSPGACALYNALLVRCLFLSCSGEGGPSSTLEATV